MKENLTICFGSIFWILILFAVLCFLWMFLVPLYERMCYLYVEKHERPNSPPDEELLRKSRRRGKQFLFLELLRSSIKYALVSGIVAIFMPPAAPLVFIFLAWCRWKLLQQFYNPNPDAWHKPLFLGIYIIMFAILIGGGGLGVTALIYGGI